MLLNLILGCSIARAWYRTKEAAFVDAYIERVGAGMREARELMRTIDGAMEVLFKSGIWVDVSVVNIRNRAANIQKSLLRRGVR